jgi:hypothetical protein
VIKEPPKYESVILLGFSGTVTCHAVDILEADSIETAPAQREESELKGFHAFETSSTVPRNALLVALTLKV